MNSANHQPCTHTNTLGKACKNRFYWRKTAHCAQKIIVEGVNFLRVGTELVERIPWEYRDANEAELYTFSAVSGQALLILMP